MCSSLNLINEFKRNPILTLKLQPKWKNVKTSLSVFSFGEGQRVGRGSICESETSASAIMYAR